MGSQEIMASFKLATEKYPGVVFRTKMEIKKYLKDCKLAVVGILGDDKSGKSTLINLMAKYLQYDKNEHDGWMEDLIDETMNVEGITTNKTFSRQSNDFNFSEDGGLYTWPQPFLLKNHGVNDPDDKIAVLLLDLNMNCITPSMQLLMCLLCSTLIYNTTSTDVSHFCRLIDTIRQSSLQFFSEGILYKCNDLLFRQLTIVFRDCSQQTSEFEFGEDKSLKYLSEIIKQQETQIYDVLNGIPHKNCYLLSNPQQGQINSRGYLKTYANFSHHMANLITQTLQFDKLSPKLYNDNSMTVETFFSMLDAICSIIIFPLSQEINELHIPGTPADDQMNINEFRSSATQMYPEHLNLQRDSRPINERTIDTYQSIPNMQTGNIMQIYNIFNTEFISVALPLPLEMLDHNQIIDNFTRETPTTHKDDTEKNYLKVVINPFTSQQGQGCRLYEKRASNDFIYYQHAEKAQAHFEKKFIEEYKKGLKSGSFLNSKIEEIFDNLIENSVQEYVSINTDVSIHELLKAVYKLPDTQKCFKKIQNIQLVQRQYLIEMNKKLEMYHFFSVEQLYKFHADATEKSFSLCEEKRTKKILDIGFFILFDEYDKINNEILQCEENNFKVDVIPKVKNFYDIEMINVTKRKITTVQLKMAHEKLKEECKVVIQKAYLFKSAKIPFLDTCFEKVDKVLKSSLKIYIRANQSKIETVQREIQAAIERSQIMYNETMNKKIENKILSPTDLTNLHKECFKSAGSKTLKFEIGSIDQTEDPRSHLAVLNLKTQKDLANFLKENNVRKKNQEMKRLEKRAAKKREAAAKMKQPNVEPKFQPPLKNQTSLNQHKNAKTLSKPVQDLNPINEKDFVPKIQNEEYVNDDETTNIVVNEQPVQNSFSVKFQIETKIEYYKNSMAELLSSTYPFTYETLLKRHNDLIGMFVSNIRVNTQEMRTAHNDFRAMMERLDDIFKSYEKCVENDSKYYQHISKLQIFISKLFFQDYEKGLQSGLFLAIKGDQFINDINEAAINDYITTNSPNVSKDEMMNIVKRLTKIQKCDDKILELQNFLKDYLCEMNNKIEIHNFFNHEQMDEFHTAAKANILPLTQHHNKTLEQGVQILKGQYDEILTKINDMEILVSSQIDCALSKSSCSNTEISIQLESIYNSAKLEIKSFSETVSIIQPESLLKLIDCRIKKKISDTISQISSEQTNLINRTMLDKFLDVQEGNSINTDTLKASIIELEKNCKETLQIEMAIKNKYHKSMIELFSSNFPVPLEMLSEKHKQLIKDATKQMACICKDKNILLTDILKIIIPRLEEAYKMYVQRAENDHSNYQHTATVVQKIFEEIFPQFYKESLISGELLDSDANEIVKKLVAISVDGLMANSADIPKEVTISTFSKLSEAKFSLKIESLQHTLKRFVLQVNEELKMNNFFTSEQMHDIHKNATQNVLQIHKNEEDNFIVEFGLMTLYKLYEICNEDIIKHELSIFRATILPRIINFYDEEMKILTQGILIAVEIIEAGEKLKKECLRAIQKACSFNKTNMQLLHTAFDEMNSVLEFRMHFFIQTNEMKILRVQDDITKCIEKSKTVYKEAMENEVERKIFSLVELMNLHKDSMYKAIGHLRQGIREINENENPFCSIKLLRMTIEQNFAQILKQNHYKKIEAVERKESGNDTNANGGAINL